MINLHAWLNKMSAEALPGGVSAAAVASAMGAALIAKVLRTTLQRQNVNPGDRSLLHGVLALACDQQQLLMSLANADERAYGAVLQRRAGKAGFPVQAEAWHEAIEVPVRVAEVCHQMLQRLPGLLDLCWPAVRPDLEIGEWLLETGMRASLLAAEVNLQACPGDRPSALQARVDALKTESG
jgi:formiminotetrahydrofolate cyclodeaminase